jgi:hypothetical protein
MAVDYSGICFKTWASGDKTVKLHSSLALMNQLFFIADTKESKKDSLSNGSVLPA